MQSLTGRVSLWLVPGPCCVPVCYRGARPGPESVLVWYNILAAEILLGSGNMLNDKMTSHVLRDFLSSEEAGFSPAQAGNYTAGSLVYQ